MATYGFTSGTDIVLELLNGNGIGAADETRCTITTNTRLFWAGFHKTLGPYCALAVSVIMARKGIRLSTSLDGRTGSDHRHA